MFSRGNRRSGFTLPEVLVTVAIVAVLAAIVVPTVTSQIGKGDDTSIVTNVATLRTGITAFVSDVRKNPARIQHLLVQPTSTDSTIPAGTYGAAAAARWRAPYLAATLKTLGNTPQDSLNWGLAYAVDVLVDTAFTSATGYIGLQLGGVSNSAAALHIDSLIDGATGQSAGSLRWLGTAPAVTGGRLTFLLMGH
jgi:prepilin-type N-terminal cleavage/methylation domain-containing protein